MSVVVVVVYFGYFSSKTLNEASTLTLTFVLPLDSARAWLSVWRKLLKLKA